uniref:ribosomal protein S11 n=1 Tax=Meteora sporadica TaxID=2913902 RepID=UPI003001BAC5|nr:ribosomal protein S11 [Meteora sporadica]WVH37095.1 ribosomal protein S11 [Meteora sporadica]
MKQSGFQKRREQMKIYRKAKNNFSNQFMKSVMENKKGSFYVLMHSHLNKSFIKKNPYYLTDSSFYYRNILLYRWYRKNPSKVMPSCLDEGRISDLINKMYAYRIWKTKLKHTGVLTVNCTYSNIFITLTNLKGACVMSITGGSNNLDKDTKFKGKQRRSPYVGGVIGKVVSNYLQRQRRFNYIQLRIKGFGKGLNPCLKALVRPKYRFQFIKMKDLTGVPHNGCRLRKKQRK